MIILKRIICIVLLIAAAMLFTETAHASNSYLPWLDFGSTFIWDSNTKTLTNDGFSTYVNSLTYLDGTSSGPPSVSPSDAVLFSSVVFSISFDGDNTNDTLSITSGGTTWLSANLDIIDVTPDPLTGTPNPYTIMLKKNGLTVANGQGSQWADEFYDTINSSLTDPAFMNIAWSDASIDLGNGKYKINAFSKIAVPPPVVPEPVSSTLFAAGAAVNLP
ncbi:MAG: hypothetical protein HY757_03410 [Nitrospirae bacterium]|nr:hypothetical protein [Nitrospirota bacterium]